MTARLDVDLKGGALVVTLANPGVRNALSPDIYPAFEAALSRARTDAAIRCVVITGADGFFCAGGDLNRLRANRDKPRAVQAASIDQLHAMITGVLACPKPVIAAVEGAAAGAGYSLALACDLIVAARDAKFVMAYVSVGLSPDGGGSWQILRALPQRLALEQMMTGLPLDATRLHAVGAVNRLCEPGCALDEALLLAKRIGTLSPHAVAAAKKLAHGAGSRTLKEHMDVEKASFVDCLHGPEAGEAIDAFLSKRAANFGHRANG